MTIGFIMGWLQLAVSKLSTNNIDTNLLQDNTTVLFTLKLNAYTLLEVQLLCNR